MTENVNRKLGKAICTLLGIELEGLTKIVLTVELGKPATIETQRIVKQDVDVTGLDGPEFKRFATIPIKEREKRQVTWNEECTYEDAS